GPPDTDSNPRVDFGFVRYFDLALEKTLAPDQPRVVAIGARVRFVVAVRNDGGVPASDIVIVDRIPGGLVLEDPDWTAAPDGRSATRTIAGPLAPGERVELPIELRVVVPTGALRNVAEIVAAADATTGAPGVDIDSMPDNTAAGEDDQAAAIVVAQSEPA